MACQEISVTQEQETAAQPAMVQAILRATPVEQHRLLAWSRGLGLIRQGDQRFHRKLGAVLRMTRDNQAGWPLVKVIARVVKTVVWDARTWKFRLGVGSVVATFIAIGNEGAAIVHLGGGIGLPLWIIIGVSGLLAGLVVDIVTKRLAKSRTVPRSSVP
jgi:hypothetical protein